MFYVMFISLAIYMKLQKHIFVSSQLKYVYIGVSSLQTLTEFPLCAQ